MISYSHTDASKREMRRVSALAAAGFAFAGGCALARYVLPGDWLLWAAAALIAPLAAGAALLRERRRRNCVLICLFAALALVWYGAYSGIYMGAAAGYADTIGYGEREGARIPLPRRGRIRLRRREARRTRLAEARRRRLGLQNRYTYGRCPSSGRATRWSLRSNSSTRRRNTAARPMFTPRAGRICARTSSPPGSRSGTR